MVSVLCGQRDRFRKRVTDLEEEIDQVSFSLLRLWLQAPILSKCSQGQCPYPGCMESKERE